MNSFVPNKRYPIGTGVLASTEVTSVDATTVVLCVCKHTSEVAKHNFRKGSVNYRRPKTGRHHLWR